MFKKAFNYISWIIVAIVIGAFFGGLVFDGSVAAYSYMEDRAMEIKLALTDLDGIAGGFSDAQIAQVPQTRTETLEEVSETPIPSYKSARLMFVGDLMLDRGVEDSVKRNFDGDFNQLFENVGFLKEADILFGNLEGPASDKGKDQGKKYSFNMDPAVIPALNMAGFNIVSFANNHIADWGNDAFLDTMSGLKKNGIFYAGAGFSKNDAQEVRMIEKNGITIGFLAFSDVGPSSMAAKEQKPGILLASDPNFEEIISTAAKEVDTLAVSFHWGEEYKEYNSRQEKLGRLAIDSGATLVIGHHPHVVQDTQKYNGGLIAYSLGNFIFDQHFSEETMQGMLLEVVIGRNPFSGEVEIWDTKKHRVKLNQSYQPQEPQPIGQGVSLSSSRRLLDEDLDEDVGLRLESEPFDLGKKHEFSHFLDGLVSSIENSCPSPEEPYPDFSLANIDQVNGIGDYIPSDLVPIKDIIDTREKDICLTKVATFWLSMMARVAQTENVHLAVTSGFRHKDTQDYLYENWIKSQVNIIQGVAIPGHSEHQLGTTVDFTSPKIKYESASASFSDSPEYVWLKENAYKYGLVESYPKGRELFTGYKYEPWHWRYVGVDNAKKIKESGFTVQEFL